MPLDLPPTADRRLEDLTAGISSLTPFLVLETATVKAIRVVEGQAVKAGDVLLELDATNANADRTRYGNDALAARALLATLDGRPKLLPAIPDAARQRQEARQLEGQWAEYQTRLARIDADITRREAERLAVQQIVAKLEKTVPLARQRAQDYKDLVDKSFISRHGYLEKEQQRIEQEGDLATQQARLAELAAAIAEGRSQRVALIAETRRIALESLNDAEQKRVAFDQEELKADSRGRQMTLTAPVAGTVQQLAVNTVGGVVTPAQALMVIVPSDNPLEVEAILDNKDIGFVSAGQEAEIKIETFPFTKYGTIPGKMTQVSGDAIADEQQGLGVCGAGESEEDRVAGRSTAGAAAAGDGGDGGSEDRQPKGDRVFPQSVVTGGGGEFEGAVMDRRTSEGNLSFPGLDQPVAEHAARLMARDSIHAPQFAPLSRMRHRTHTTFLEADMLFVIEEIPEDVITTGVLSRFPTYAKDRYFPISTHWAVDRERNARIAIVSAFGGTRGVRATVRTKQTALLFFCMSTRSPFGPTHFPDPIFLAVPK